VKIIKHFIILDNAKKYDNRFTLILRICKIHNGEKDVGALLDGNYSAL